MKDMEAFVGWHSKNAAYVQRVSALLMVPLNDEPEALIKQAEEIEAHNGRIGFLLADANGFLDIATAHFTPEKREGMSERDRKVIVEKEVSPIRAVRDKLEHLCDCIKSRLILAESLLRYHSQFHDRDVRKPQFSDGGKP